MESNTGGTLDAAGGGGEESRDGIVARLGGDGGKFFGVDVDEAG